MNILITLPKNLINKIISGEKDFEMRKCFPKYMEIGKEGFYIVEKGTDNVRCWCRVDDITGHYINPYYAGWFAQHLCVSEEYIEKYANGKKVYLWKIGKVKMIYGLSRISLCIDKNPQQFVYTPPF